MNLKTSRGVLALVLLVLALLSVFLLPSSKDSVDALEQRQGPQLETPVRSGELVTPGLTPSSEFTGREPVVSTGEASADAEREGAAALTPKIRSLNLRVSFADGLPAGSGWVLLSSDTEFLEWSRLDRDGRASIGRAPGGLRLYVIGCSPTPLVEPLQEGLDEIELFLPAGEEFSGQVLVDGAPPREPMAFTVNQPGPGPSWDFGLPRIPSEVMNHELWGQWDPRDLIVSVGSASLFRSTGWEEKGSLFLELPLGYGFEADGAEVIVFEKPANGVELRLTREALLHGRVIAAESGDPAARVQVELGPKGVSPRRATTDESGEFTIEVPKDSSMQEGRLVLEPVSKAQLVLRSHDNRQRLSQTVRFDPKAGGELGVFQLQHAGTLTLDVVDLDGKPVAGARVRLAGNSREKKANKKGRVKLKGLASGELRIDVYSSKHKTAGLVLSSLPSEPVTVVLEPCATLELSLSCAEEGDLAGHMVECVTAARLFETEEGSVLSLIDAEFQARRFSLAKTFREGRVILGSEGATQTNRFSVSSRGPVLLTNLRAGQDVALRVLDASGAAVWPAQGAGEVIRLAPGEQRSMEIQVPCGAGLLRGRVEDEEGQPLSGIRVRYTASKIRSGDPKLRERIQFNRVESNTDGEFVITGLTSPLIDLYVREGDYAHVLQERVALDASPVLTLRAGRSVQVLARDPSGEPVRVQVAEAFRGAFRVGEGRRGEDSGYLCYDLPPESLTIEAMIGGRRFRAVAAHDQTQIVIDVPPRGSIDVAWNFAYSAEAHIFGVRIDGAGDNGTLSFSMLNSPEKNQGTRIIEPAFPGRYSATLYTIDRKTERVTELAGPKEFEVVAGEQAKVELAP